MPRRPALIGRRAALLAAALVAAIGSASAAPVGGLQVRYLSPISRTPHLPHTFACLDPKDGPPNVDVEPTIVANPVDANDLITGWWTGQAGFKRIAVAGGYAVTRDGGRTWKTGVPRHVDSCSGRPAYSVAGAHDEWLAFAPSGRRVYLLVESGRHLAPPGSHIDEPGNTNTLWIYASKDGGATWGRAVRIVDASLATGGPDQPRVVVDPTDENRLYLVWRQIPRSAFKTGDIGGAPGYFSRSVDGGRTWSAPRQIITPPSGGPPEGPMVQHPFVLSNGTVVDIFDETHFFDSIGNETPAHVEVIRSRDHGRSWSKPIIIAAHSPLPFLTDPHRKKLQLIGTGASSAMGPDGTLYVVWGDRVGRRRLLELEFSKSTDGGRTWSSPERVGDTTTAALGETIAVAGDGTVGVLYYDNRRDRPGGQFWASDVFLDYSGDRGVHWRERHLAGPMNLARAPVEGHYPARFLQIGDYYGLAGLPHGFAAAFTVTKPKAIHGRTDIFFARISER